ncbi:PREDICTED: uncharacterized protein LOC104815392 [Tarenaya hassleriana]|uniref:uncharacterized protein LOC104815392 n=1 Tax=Tarenaya hassleriana TaxID=28532 RepID=UPI00053C54A8|nr:PREDICTED: uncharacterized protein LOC104815392 [Tarenaya hassleriana]
MNSMFSSFDALCAELMGMKIAAASAFSGCSERNAAAAGDQSATQKTDKKKTRSLQKTPRFAPELDGLHCFETIIPS